MQASKQFVLTVATLVVVAVGLLFYAPAINQALAQDDNLVAEAAAETSLGPVLDVNAETGVVMLQGEFGYFPAGTDGVELIQGTHIGRRDGTMAAEYARGEGIIWRLEPGTYEITVLGRAADPMRPQRIQETHTIVISGPVEATRDDQIRAASAKMYMAMLARQLAEDELNALNPTAEELLAALGAKVSE